jgi:hypothetical protein
LPLLTTPLSQVTYEQLIKFCETFSEGPRVEYKREPGKHTPKIVSSFANTVGGVWVIGIDADQKTNMAILPPVGLPLEPGIEERITQSALMGIYPGITPDVRVFEMPDKPRHAVVVVKVAESVEAPHAIENSTRVYVRTASTSEPSELADIDRIEYLLQRRRDSTAARERIIDRAHRRSYYGPAAHRVRVVVCPVFPRGALFSRDELWDRAEKVRASGDPLLRYLRLIDEAVATPRDGAVEFYVECNVGGVVYYEAPGHVQGEVGGIPYVLLPELLSPLGKTLNTATPFLGDRLTNILIRYELYGWQGKGFLVAEPVNVAMADRAARESACIDARVTVETTVVAEDLIKNRLSILVAVMQDLLWAFNHRSSTLPERVTAAAKEAGFC